MNNTKKKARLSMLTVVGLCCALLSTQTYALEKKVFYHNNLLGSPVAATDESGNLCWREDYRPYGEKIRNEDQGCGLDDNVTGFTGHVHDKDIGLTYMQARYYDPVVGRFMGVDPVGFGTFNPSSFNRFSYANNNPFRYRDPNGKIVQELPILVGIGLLTIYTALPNKQREQLNAEIARRITGMLSESDDEEEDDYAGRSEGPAVEAQPKTTKTDRHEWIYGPEDDDKVNEDGSTNGATYTTPDEYDTPEKATNRLAPYKPIVGRRKVVIPKGTTVQDGTVQGQEGIDLDSEGGGNETRIPGGLPPGSVGEWESF